MTTPTVEADRRRLADYLADHGATPGFSLRDAMGWKPDRFWEAVFGPGGGWFTITTYGWALTERGERDGPALRTV